MPECGRECVIYAKLIGYRLQAAYSFWILLSKFEITQNMENKVNCFVIRYFLFFCCFIRFFHSIPNVWFHWREKFGGKNRTSLRFWSMKTNIVSAYCVYTSTQNNNNNKITVDTRTSAAVQRISALRSRFSDLGSQYFTNTRIQINQNFIYGFVKEKFAFSHFVIYTFGIALNIDCIT